LLLLAFMFVRVPPLAVVLNMFWVSEKSVS